MVIFIIVFSILAGIHLYIIKKEWLNPGTIFMFYWAFVVFMASLRLYGLRETSNKAYLFVAVGVFFFYLGSLLKAKVKFTFKKHRSLNLLPVSEKCKTNFRLLNIAAIVIIIYSLYRIRFIISLLGDGYSWWAIRLMSASGEGGEGTLKGGTLSDVVYSFIVSPLIYLIVPIIITEIFQGKKKWFSLILTILAMLTYSIATVSRAIWAFSIIYVVSTFFLMKKNQILTIKQKKIAKFVPIIVIILALIINKITNLRNSEADIFINAYAYIAGCMPILSIHLEETISQIRTYGMLTLYGFLNPIFFVTNYLHLFSFPEPYTNAKLVKDNLETFFSIAPNINMNAYATLFYDFYIDFGWIGIAIGSFGFGFLCMKAFNLYKHRKDTFSLVLYLILLQFILFSVARIYTVYATRALSLIWIFIMFKRAKEKKSIGG